MRDAGTPHRSRCAPTPSGGDERNALLRDAHEQCPDRRHVEMIVVIVREHDRVELRHVVQRHRRRMKALWARTRCDGETRCEYRVDEDAMAVDLDQCARVAEPRDAEPTRRRCCEIGRRARDDRERCRRNSLFLPPELATHGVPEGSGTRVVVSTEFVERAVLVCGDRCMRARRSPLALAQRLRGSWSRPTVVGNRESGIGNRESARSPKAEVAVYWTSRRVSVSHVIPSGAAKRRSRGIAVIPVEGPLSFGTTAIPRLRRFAAPLGMTTLLRAASRFPCSPFPVPDSRFPIPDSRFPTTRAKRRPTPGLPVHREIGPRRSRSSCALPERNCASGSPPRSSSYTTTTTPSAIGFGPTERTPRDTVDCGLRQRRQPLLHSRPTLPDRDKLLEGNGTQGRFMRLTSAAQLDDAKVAALISVAVAHGRVPMAPKGRGHTIVKSVSAKQRPRRPSRSV